MRKMKTPAKTLATALAACGLAAAAMATPAHAADAERMTISVPTADINLATAAGQRTLDRRLQKAARTVCRTDSLTVGSRIMTQEARECLARARADARQQLATLTATQIGAQQRGG
jgi:UrcA family protein